MLSLVNIGDAVALLALILSVYATWKILKFNKRQETLIESQEELNRLLLEKGQRESMSEMSADLSANFVRIGNNKIRLKIYNKGKATARNIRVEFPDGNDVLMESEISEKFPLESLEQYQSVELIAATALGTKRKHTIRLIWDDESSTLNEKTVYPTL